MQADPSRHRRSVPYSLCTGGMAVSLGIHALRLSKYVSPWGCLNQAAARVNVESVSGSSTLQHNLPFNHMNRQQVLRLLTLSLFFLGSSAVNHCTDCNSLGVCQTNGKCRCYAAYSFPVVNGTAQTDSCIDTVLSDNPVGVKTIRGISAGVSFILFCLIAWRLYLELTKESDDHINNVGLRRVVKFSLCIDGLICFLMFLLSALDWWGNFGVMPSEVYNALYNFIDWLYVLLFVGILLHWAELYQKTMKSIRTRDMMKKVNSNYSGDVTVEQVMSNLTFLQRFKIPFVIITGVTFLIWIARIIGSRLINEPKSWSVFYPFVILFYAVVWLGFGLGFGFYGYKLMRVMPLTMGLKIRRITLKIVAVLVLQILNCIQIILFTAFVPGLSNSIFGRNAITFVIRLIVSFIILEIYMPLSKIRLWFSHRLLSSSSSSGANSSSRTGNSNEVSAVAIEVPAVAIEVNASNTPPETA
ncbi:hypothetical protein PROFUN_06824 [Planoprotostelium fungivorum]|uniref:Uncharacterized protein n=1 Tax=Planoprotostelium fungivorum TaxID=1890364 RepID=A0A2P6NNC3_9EUKA|nr:hypothetical protein PROFUN_06824 [Planoprotostelium fungivorum]